MGRYIVATRRNVCSTAPSARAVLQEESDVHVIDDSDPHLVTIEATAERAAALQQKLSATHIVEPETRRGLH